MKMKMPIVSIYLTPKQLQKQLDSLSLIIQFAASQKEKPLAVRIRGRINYHDLVKIQKMKKIIK